MLIVATMCHTHNSLYLNKLSVAQGEVNIDACFWTLEGAGTPEGKHIDVTLAKKAMGYNNWEALLETDKVDMSVTDRCVCVLYGHERDKQVCVCVLYVGVDVVVGGWRGMGYTDCEAPLGANILADRCISRTWLTVPDGCEICECLKSFLSFTSCASV